MAWIETLQDKGYLDGCQIYVAADSLIGKFETHHILFCTTEARLKIFVDIAKLCQQLLTIIEGASAPDEVEVSIISGGLRTQLLLFSKEKTGSREQAAFFLSFQEVVQYITVLTNRLIQAAGAWKRYFPKPARAPEVADGDVSAAVPVSGPVTSSVPVPNTPDEEQPLPVPSPSRMTTMLLHLNSIDQLRIIIERFKQFPELPSENDASRSWQVTRRAFSKHRALTFSGVTLFVLAVGAGSQVGFESLLFKLKNEPEKRDPLSVLYAVALVIFSFVLAGIAFGKGWQEQPRRPVSRRTNSSVRDLDRRLIQAAREDGIDGVEEAEGNRREPVSRLDYV